MTQQPDLAVRVGGLELANPVIAASGTFGCGREYADLYDVGRLGAIVAKSVTLHPRAGNPPPRVYETAAGMLNSIGLANLGVDHFIRDDLPFLRELDTVVIVNVAGATKDDYLEVVARLEDADGADALEINISCPNVKEGGIAFGSDPEVAADLISRCVKATSLPVIAKLTPNVTDVVAIARAVFGAGASAVSLINTLTGMAVDWRARRPVLGNVVGGLSGPAVKPVALRMVWQVASAGLGPVIGIGGIMSAADVLAFMVAGASACQVGTANFADPLACSRIIDEMPALLAEAGVSRAADLTGTLRTTPS